MSVAKDEDELEQHLPDGSNDEQMDTIVEEDESPSMVQNHIESGPGEEYASEDKNFSVPSEDRLDDGSDFVETPELNTCTQTSNRLSRSKNHDDKGLAMRDDRILNQVNHLHENSSSLNVKPEPVNGLGDLYHDSGEDLIDTQTGGNEAEMVQSKDNGFSEMAGKQDMGEEYPIHREGSNQSYHLDRHLLEGDESGTEEEQAAFTRELESFFKERSMEFKPPKFYGEGLNCLKLWRAVTRLGGYDQVTSCKLWRQVGESFKPPKTCTTVSWSFRCFYEKALLDYERHKLHGGELPVPVASLPGPSMSMAVENPLGGNQAPGSGRARRDAAARAMQGWHSQRLLGNGEVGDPIIKDKNSVSLTKREKQLKSLSMLKRKKPSRLERAVKAARTKVAKPQMDTTVVDIGPCADWVKINVQRTKDCFEVYALVPGLLREEVCVQSDPAGRLVISGEPEQPDNPWGVTPFKKVISLPSRIDPNQTSAVVTLHGQLFVRAPFEQSDL